MTNLNDAIYAVTQYTVSQFRNMLKVEQYSAHVRATGCHSPVTHGITVLPATRYKWTRLA